jgi:uncharacterized protein
MAVAVCFIMVTDTHIYPAAPQDILKHHDHRPYALPEGHWLLYQGWRNVLMLHFPVSAELLKPLLPQGLMLDTMDGWGWVSFASFRVVDTHPRLLPPLPPISDFFEINFRTYVTDGRISGVHFMEIKADKLVSVLLNKTMGLPYEKEDIHLNDNRVELYCDDNRILIDVNYSPSSGWINKTALDNWLMERYFAYQEDGGKLFRYPIHHVEWPLQPVSVETNTFKYSYRGLHLSHQDITLAHYSEGVNMLNWAKEKV